MTIDLPEKHFLIQDISALQDQDHIYSHANYALMAVILTGHFYLVLRLLFANYAPFVQVPLFLYKYHA